MQIGGFISANDPVRFTAPLPDAADVVIIGGGVVGVATALYLTRAGQSVVLCEKGRIACEQSSRNWGWVRQQGRDLAELPIMIESMRLWEGLQQELGDRVGLRRTGVTYLAESEDQLARYAAWMDSVKDFGLDTRMVTRAELAVSLPSAAEWVGGLTTPSDARAEPWTAVPAMAELAAREGATIIEDCAVRTIDTTNGQVAGVVTEKGPIGADRVLVAGGAWSSLFLRNAGVSIPQLSVRATAAATAELPDFWKGAAVDSRFAFRRRLDGGYTLAPGTGHDFWIGPDAVRAFRKYLPQLCRDFRSTNMSIDAPTGYPDAWRTPRRWRGDQQSPFERMRVLDPPPNMAFVERFHESFGKVFPDVGPPPIKRSWAGMIDTMPDQVPILDESPVKGMFIATGLAGHGFGIGPGVGRVMADLLRGLTAGYDLTRFRFSRFSDGSRIEMGPSL
ncbi:MAG: FAD-dependent oxidoreductase [Paracoccus denitrificans]|nr:MAG: FAD-dependent oxidoreductase [Paracoccus denitrificans]PZO83820.1 MAG: FAD-dependent oxidoreductase [Paracoccus denitrificans]